MIVTGSADVLAFFAYDNGGACVLAGGKDAVGGDFRVLEQHQGNHAVIVRGISVIENRSHLLQVRAT